MSSLRGLSYRASLLVRNWISASTPPPLFLSAGAVADAKLWRRRSGMPFMSPVWFCHTQARRRGSSAIFALSGEVRAVASCFSPCATAAVSSHPLVVVTLLLPQRVRRRELGTLVHNVKVKGDMMEKAPQHHHNGSGDGAGVAQLLQFLDSLKNYEREGVPQGAGTDSDAGFDLQRMHRLLLHLGNPLSCYSVVHVAGTKGKGSTVAFISNILRSAGLSVGTYTSPHLTSIRERITTGKTGDPISDEMLVELFSNLHANLDKAIAAEPGTLTHFEVLTALAFSHFAREKVDLAVVETGLGGARDATNVISAKGLAAAVIVGIGTEHLAALGGSLESIALAKSGIIKDGRPVVVGQQKDSTTKDIILKVAASKEAPVRAAFGSSAQCEIVEVCSGSDAPFQICNFFLDDTSEIESVVGVYKVGDENVRLSALGAHQQENALTAISTVLSLRHQGWNIPDSSIRAGLEATVIPGRFQILDQHKAQALGFSNARVILDGAHTEASANALACTLMEYFPTAKLALVVGMASDKDHFAFARSLLEEAQPHLVVTTRVSVAGSLERSTSGAELAQSWCQAAKSANMEVILQSVQQPLVDHSNQTHNVSHRTRSADKAAIMAQDYTGSKGSVVVLEAEKMEAAISMVAKYVEQRSDETQRMWVVCITGSLHGVATALSLLPR